MLRVSSEYRIGAYLGPEAKGERRVLVQVTMSWWPDLGVELPPRAKDMVVWATTKAVEYALHEHAMPALLEALSEHLRVATSRIDRSIHVTPMRRIELNGVEGHIALAVEMPTAKAPTLEDLDELTQALENALTPQVQHTTWVAANMRLLGLLFVALCRK